MASTKACEERMERFRDIMRQRGYDAAIIRNNPDLRWLTGAERTFDFEVAHTAFITLDGQWLHTDSRYYGTFQKRLGPDTAWQLDMDLVDAAAWAARHVGESRARVVAVEDTWDLGFYERFEHQLKEQSLAALLPRMHGDIAHLREVKDDEEVELMRHAQSITDAAFTYICGYIKPGMTEMQIKNELESYMFAHGADALSFDSIIAAGPNGANPHAQPSDYVVQKGDMIVMDYGAGYHDYHSDMTRTVCVGEPTDEQRHVYDVVLSANAAVRQQARAGIPGKQMHELATKIISDAGYGDYFKHGLGHGVGLEIHEQPMFNRTNDKPVPAGAVITDEPGIYLPGKFGVRIEDFGIVREDGYEVFTQSPHELQVVGC
ncbi:MAG: aminopeptidase P family protein [Coriobacteriales bacterium]|nr:aminopeptidase P family protein [Coriobacteriales bacterium]